MDKILRHLTPIRKELEQLPFYGKSLVAIDTYTLYHRGYAVIKVCYKKDNPLSAESYRKVNDVLVKHGFERYKIYQNRTIKYKKELTDVFKDIRVEGLKELLK